MTHRVDVNLATMVRFLYCSYFLLLFNTLLFDASLKGQPTLNGVIGWEIKFPTSWRGKYCREFCCKGDSCLFLPI